MEEKKDMRDHDMMEHTHYTCSMHPEDMHDHPGNCSVCGMALVSIGTAEDDA